MDMRQDLDRKLRHRQPREVRTCETCGDHYAPEVDDHCAMCHPEVS